MNQDKTIILILDIHAFANSLQNLIWILREIGFE